MSIDVVLLLGGHGARMGALTAERPKYLLEVDGQPILLHILDQVRDAFGRARVILATGRHGDMVRDLLGDSFSGLRLEHVQDSRHLETRRRIELMEGVIKGPFIVLGSDVLAHSSLLQALADRRDRLAGEAIAVIGAADTHDPTHGHALVRIRRGMVEDYRHHPPEVWAPDEYRDMHAYAFGPDWFPRSRSAPEEHVWIERVIMWARGQGHTFGGEIYSRPWHHFAEARDLETRIDFSAASTPALEGGHVG